MLGCTETVTVISKNKGIDDDLYICKVFDGASWHSRVTISTSGDGAKPVNTYECRIMGDIDIEVKTGDYVAKGIVESIEKPADLKNIDHFRITAVGDNRRGKLAHWRLSGQ